MRQHIRFVETNDAVRLAVARSGKGPTLVKAAHYLTHVEHDWESPVWRHWLRDLTLSFDLVRYDERGCGLSDWEVTDFSMAAWVHDLETVVDSLEIDQFALLGISQGGAVAIEYAAAHPQRVSHLVLYGAYAQGRFRRDSDTEQLREAEVFLEAMRVGWGRDNPAFRQLFTSHFLPGGTKEQMDAFNELQRLTTSPANAVRFERAFYEIDATAAARTVEVPTLVLHARADQMVPVEQGRRLAGLLPDARFVSLDSGNHILLEELAWEKFMAELTSFAGAPAMGRGGPAPLMDLTRREMEVLELIAQGISNADIASELFISPHTVRNHINRIFRKLDVERRAQAIVLARAHGLGSGQVEADR